MKIRIGDFQWRLRVRARGMRTGTSITVSATDRRRLEKIVSDRNAAQKPVWWSEIVPLTARGQSWPGRARRRPPSGGVCIGDFQWRLRVRGRSGGVPLRCDPATGQGAHPDRKGGRGRAPDPGDARGDALDGAGDGPGRGSSSSPAILPLLRNSPISRGSMSARPRMRWCSRRMKSRTFRRLIAPGRGCRSRKDGAPP